MFFTKTTIYFIIIFFFDVKFLKILFNVLRENTTYFLRWFLLIL